MHAYKLSVLSDPPKVVTVPISDNDSSMADRPEAPIVKVTKQNYVCCLYDNEA